MKRNKQRTSASAVLTADWHLREDSPVCRTDDFWEAQKRKVQFITELAKTNNCPILHAGDLFNHWKPSPALLSFAIKSLEGAAFWTIYGNHDLPQHNQELGYKSGLHTLVAAQRIQICDGIHWGDNPNKKLKITGDSHLVGDRVILMAHIMTYEKQKAPWPGITDLNSQQLLRKWKQPDLILTGHNHHSFVTEKEGRLLVNPGSITRQTADQIDFQPKIYLYYAKTNTVKAVSLPIQKGVVSRKHIEKQDERDNRYEAFIQSIRKDSGMDVDFKVNLERHISKNKIKEPISQKMWEAVDNG